MKGQRVLFSSASDHWATPTEVYDALNQEFKFTDDPCPLGGNGGLDRAWGGSTFVNPPYSEIGAWIKKGAQEAQAGKTVVFLIPSRTDTKWWHEFVMTATEIRFIKGRLKFGGAKNSAPFPSCVVIWRAHL